MPAPIVEVIGQETPDLPQSKFPELPKLPCRVLACAPSGGFKTTTILWMLMRGYVNKDNKPLFSRVYYFSKTAHVDPKLRELEKWAKKTLKQPEDEPVLYNEFDNATVERLLHEISETAAYMKKRNKPPFSVAIIVDDFAEIPQVVRGPHLTSLFLKGRHFGCSTFVSSQGFRLLSPAIRKNAISLLVGRLRTESDVLAIADELGGSLPGGKRQVEELIKRVTTSAPHSFLYVDLSASPERMFHANWEPLSLTDL